MGYPIPGKEPYAGMATGLIVIYQPKSKVQSKI
jgi:hypothetical protein